MDDIEIVETDDDYYAFLNLPRDVSYQQPSILAVYFGFAIHIFCYIFTTLFLHLVKIKTGDFGANQCRLQASVEDISSR